MMLIVSRDLRYDFVDYDEVIIKYMYQEYGLDPLGSGAGMGRRDLEFSCQTEYTPDFIDEMRLKLAKVAKDRSIQISFRKDIF